MPISFTKSNLPYGWLGKIEQHPQLKEELIKTGDLTIIEDVTSRASPKTNNMIWGMAQLPDSSWVGKNVLGKLWMKIRSELQEKNKC